MIPEKFIYIGVFLNFIGQLLYLRSIVWGSTKPNLVSWFTWMLAPFVGVFLQLKAGAGLSVLPVFMAGFGPLLVIVLSLLRKNAYWKVTQFDLICGALSIMALILYILTSNLGVSILFAILSDGLAAIPTLIKSWKFPETESGTIYFFGIVSNTMGLFIIKDWSFSIYSFSVYIILINLAILACIYRKKFLSLL